MPWAHWRTLDATRVHASDDATYVKKLPQSNVLHTILLLAQMENGATNNQGLGMTDAIDWIKVVAGGSQVLAYLEPETIRMIHLYDTGENLDEIHDEQGGNDQFVALPIKFGRSWFDPNHYLDLSAFNDIEVQIKYSPTISATTFATGTFQTTILGLMSMNERPGPYEGTLVTRIIENFTTAASGDEVIEPPQRHPWRGLFVRCYEAGVADGTDLTDVQFDLNDEARTPLNLSWDELHHLNFSLRPVFPRKSGIFDRQDGDTVNVAISRILQAITNHRTAEVLSQVSGITGDQLTLSVNDQGTQAVDEGGAATFTIHADYATDAAIDYDVKGKGLPFSVFIPLWHEDKMPYFDPTRWDQAKLTLTQGAAGGDTDIVLQEVQRL